MSDRIFPHDSTTHDGRVRFKRWRGAAFICGCIALLVGLTVAQDARAEPTATPDASDMTNRMRAIVADPAVRDFAGPAENAFDFSKPDGVPGFGPMRATDDLDQLHAQATGRPAAPRPDEALLGIASAGQ
jgi:hypothetical protein